MADPELRRLERYVFQNPTDYGAWYQYLSLSARQGAFNPLDFEGFRYLVTKVRQPRPNDYEMDSNNIERQQAERQRFHQANDEYHRSEEIAHHLLRNMRAVLGPQWPAPRLATYVSRILNALYEQTYVVQCPEADGQRQRSDEPDILIGQNRQDAEGNTRFDPGSFTICYNETHRVVRIQPLEFGRYRRPYWATEPRNVLDLIPQYILMVEVHYAGSYHQPPDSDIVEVAVTSDPEVLVRELIWAQENDANQEAYYNPALEYDEHTEPTLTDRLNFAVNSLRTTLRGFLDFPRVTSDGEDIYIESAEELILWHFKDNQVESLSEKTETFPTDFAAFAYIWRYWLRKRLEVLLGQIKG